LNIDYYLKKKHIFKCRRLKIPTILRNKNKEFYIYTTKAFRFELVYIRLFKKLLRRKFIKANTRFFKLKYWVNLKPNYILTKKSKNSRMGAGTGNFLRLSNIIKPGNFIIKTYMYKLKTLQYINKYLNYKLSKNFLIK